MARDCYSLNLVCITACSVIQCARAGLHSCLLGKGSSSTPHSGREVEATGSLAKLRFPLGRTSGVPSPCCNPPNLTTSPWILCS